jgi:hypothetical protein
VLISPFLKIGSDSAISVRIRLGRKKDVHVHHPGKSSGGLKVVSRDKKHLIPTGHLIK